MKQLLAGRGGGRPPVMVLGATGALVLAFGLGACGGSSGSGGDTKTVVTIVKTEPSAPPADTGSGSSEDPGNVTDGGGGSGGGKLTVPDEVGKQHQAAQDDLQAHGFFNLSEEDATGQGRLLLFDRNWKVVSQSPPPGTKASEDATITLRAKKYTDP